MTKIKGHSESDCVGIVDGNLQLALKQHVQLRIGQQDHLNGVPPSNANDQSSKPEGKPMGFNLGHWILV